MRASACMHAHVYNFSGESGKGRSVINYCYIARQSDPTCPWRARNRSHTYQGGAGSDHPRDARRSASYDSHLLSSCAQ